MKKILSFAGALLVFFGGYALLVAVLSYDESSRDQAFIAKLDTRLFYSGDNEENRTSGHAVVLIPSSNESTERQYYEIECNLTDDQYDQIRAAMVSIGTRRYADWAVWRGRLLPVLNCAFVNQRPWQPRTDLPSERIIEILDLSFLFELRSHDAN